MSAATVSAVTLGCKVNQVDTQAMLELFEAQGYEVLPFGQPTDVILVNTCTVTGTGEAKSRKAIRQAVKLSPHAAIVVAGCLAQAQAEQLMRMPGVRVVLGNRARGDVVRLLERALAREETVVSVDGLEDAAFEALSADAIDGRVRAVLKIQEGCENRCSYCIIPSVRGPVRSRPLGGVRQEVGRLCDAGFREIVLTGIHLNSYGKDLDGPTFADAVEAALLAAQGRARIRLGSLEPTARDGEFAARLKGYGHLCPQFHLSLQSGSDTVLARMRRRYNTAQYERSVHLLREAFPGCAITTDVIAGFPGETQAEHEQTMAFLERIGFARVHVFPYSQREGTPAAALDGQLPMEERRRRAQGLIALAETLADRYLMAQIGKTLTVLFEQQEHGLCQGHSETYLTCCQTGAPLGVPVAFVPVRAQKGVLYGPNA